MPQFEIVSDFGMTGDQPQAVDKLVEGLDKGFEHQTLLGYIDGQGKLDKSNISVIILGEK